MKLVNQDVTLQEIIDKLGISRKTLYKWRKRGAKPDALKGLKTARKKGWIPLTRSSDLFPLINRICAWVLSGGCILHSFNVELSGRVCDLEGLKNDVASLDLNPILREGEGRKRGPTLSAGGKGASPFGRVIHSLGVPRGEKAKQKYTLPGYLKNASERIRKDFLNVYLSNRMILLEGNRGFVLRLERYGEYRKAGRKLYSQLNRLMEETVGAEGSLFATWPHVSLYFDKGKAEKVLNDVDLRYNREKRRKAEERFE
ncbi:hypothetical protein AKJ51_03750 [candidate division MSBL1 archaeon SCGC-AAA382A20]|uniref:Uncharacterized protein n=1 Tax=candidate division MSBL1 archaeon SCGC-AAA382A20 TaxID=1698280 RepID=A0A133VJ11_9EURY|nr:hypothetical protein AKJ51_03750 [candidate division MSBL1 archaeon SCGC-AAA382A20]